MTEETAEQMRRIVRDIRMAMQTLCVHDAATFLFTTMANTVGPFPESAWEQLEAAFAEPCSKPGCDCHIMRGKVFAALTLARTDWRTHVDLES